MEKGISPATMPLMSLVSTWLDQTVPSRAIVEKNVSKFLATDTACFLAEPEMRILRRRQNQHFGPILEWFKVMPVRVRVHVLVRVHIRVRALLRVYDGAGWLAGWLVRI